MKLFRKDVYIHEKTILKSMGMALTKIRPLMVSSTERDSEGHRGFLCNECYSIS